MDEFEEKMQSMHKPDISSDSHQLHLKIMLLNARRSAGIGVFLVLVPCLFLAGIFLTRFLNVPFPLFSTVEEWMSKKDNSVWIKVLIPFLLVGGPLIALAFNLLAEKLSSRYHVKLLLKNPALNLCPITGRFTGTETLEQIIYPIMIKKLNDLDWNGFGLWAQHEPVFKQTILDEINYQRSADGLITLDCEDHNCLFRAITVPLVKNDDCLICCITLDNINRSYPTCFHSSTCKHCFKLLDKCPLCRKPFNSNERKTLI